MGLIWFWVPTKYPKPSFKVLENHGRPLAVTPNPWMNTLKVKGNIHIMGLQWFWVAVNYPEPSFRVLENQVRPLAVTPNPWVNAVPRLQRTWFRVALFEPQPELRVPTSHLTCSRSRVQTQPSATFDLSVSAPAGGSCSPVPIETIGHDLP